MIMTKLKEQTKQQHEMLERNLNILSKTETVDAYKSLLEKFYGFHFPLENHLFAEAEKYNVNIDLKDRRKARMIVEDLLFLGMTEDEISNLPKCEELPALGSKAHILGCFYVIEGSTLGGQFISRHIKEKLGFDERGTSFFRSYGEKTGAMWKAFGNALNEYAFDRNEDEAIIESAKETFTKFDRWLFS